MDPSSIITQVNRENGNSEPCTLGTASTISTPVADTEPVAPLQIDTDSNHVINEKGPKKKHQFFHSLLCCFGKGYGKHKPVQGDLGPTETVTYSGEEHALLPQIKAEDAHKKCLVIDLDETLVHSSFKPISNADFIVPVEIDGTIHQVYVLKRPYVDQFLMRVGELYECVLFTASLAKYADPVTDLLDKWDVFRSRLFRESCVFHRGNYVKDLGRLGRELGKIIIVDNSPASYIFHPENAVPVVSWFDDMENKELLELIPFFEELSTSDNIYTLLRRVQRTDGAGSGGAGGMISQVPSQQRV